MNASNLCWRAAMRYASQGFVSVLDGKATTMVADRCRTVTERDCQRNDFGQIERTLSGDRVSGQRLPDIICAASQVASGAAPASASAALSSADDPSMAQISPL